MGDVEYWDCCVRMSKPALYEVLYAVIMHKGAITCCFTLGCEQYNKRQNAFNTVDLRIRLPKGQKESFEQMSGVKLEEPPVVQAN